MIRLWREPQGSVEPPAADREWLDAACPEPCPERSRRGSRRAHHEWLVQVEHIPGGEKEYFASLEELFAFIREQLPGPRIGRGAGEQGRQGEGEMG